MADQSTATDGLSPFDEEAYDFTKIPDFDNDFVSQEDIDEFAKALAAPEQPTFDQAAQPAPFVALNDWKPVAQRARKLGRRKRKRRPPVRGRDETREGYVYSLLKWPLLVMVMGWIIVLGAAYFLTRLYIASYEQFVSMRGQREKLRRRLQSATTYVEWVEAAKQMDRYLGNDAWKEKDIYDYYNSGTIRSVRDELRRLRTSLESSFNGTIEHGTKEAIADELRILIEAAVKDNFVGIENSRLYSETYYGTKSLVQSFVDEVELSLTTVMQCTELSKEDKTHMFKHLYTNYGRTALCLSGGATFAYYHFGVAKALLDAGVLPEVITGTSGGALIAALLCTRTDDELKKLLVPALAGRIKACQDGFATWFPRWYRTGARFSSVAWARACAWFCHGSLTFREARDRTGRILNVTCIPSDPHSPAVLANYLTAPDCVIWSAVLASAAVPGIINPVVLMRKTRHGKLVPYSFGHKWKDGSLRTDVPLKALNTHFNVNFSIVSQVNPHINLFFFSSRGAVGRPVTHRRGRGWRGGFLGSATEQYLKLDLTKWLKVLRHLELLPRPLGQDWSEIWLQRFSGTVTIWPKSILSDFFHILSDPPPSRLARMIHVGQQSAFPKILFISNRMKVERLIEEGNRATHGDGDRLSTVLSEKDLHHLLEEAHQHNGSVALSPMLFGHRLGTMQPYQQPPARSPSPSVTQRFSDWWSKPSSPQFTRRSSVISELGRQSRVFVDDMDLEDSDGDGSAQGSAAEEGDAFLSEGEELDGREEVGLEGEVEQLSI